MSAVAPVTLVGRHARLEPLSFAHIPDLVRAAQSGSRETFAFASAPGDEAGMRAWVEEAIAEQAAGTALLFTTRAAASGDVVGGTRFAGSSSGIGRRAALRSAAPVSRTWRRSAGRGSRPPRNAPASTPRRST